MVNRQAPKYIVWYYPVRGDYSTDKHKSFNCATSAVQFAYGCNGQISHGKRYLSLKSVSGLWCEYHERNEYF